MSASTAGKAARDERVDRILGFLRSLYLRTQIEAVRLGFQSVEDELAELLCRDEQSLDEALAWVKELSGSGNPPASGAAPKMMPHVMAMSFAILANQVSIGSDNDAIGSFVPSHRSQLLPDRAVAMRSLVRDHFAAPIAALEIGTWFGAGSTQVWIEVLPPGSSLFLLDAWARYITDNDRDGNVNRSYRLMDRLPQAALAATVRQMFRAEERLGNDIEFVLMRGKSSRVLDLFRDATFDLIYIDGSHYYADVKRDIELAKSRSKPDFSIVCGDDLETLDPVLVEAGKRHLDRDFVILDGIGFHPGVALAVTEELPEARTADGFWWAIKRNGSWSA
jgi:hypothetical protein